MKMRCRKAPSNEVKSESNIDNLAGRNVCHGSNPWRRECFSPDFSLRYARPLLFPPDKSGADAQSAIRARPSSIL